MASTCHFVFYIFLTTNLLYSVAGQDVTTDPCDPANHVSVDEPRRSTGFILSSNSQPRCDSHLKEGWYRFTSRAGGKIPTTCQDKNKCGTIVPLWMKGSHPSVADGPVTRQVCGDFYSFDSSGSACCDKTIDIRVKNCGPFFIYYLFPVPSCPVAYCAGEHAPCPDGKWSPTGFPPCKDAFPLMTTSPTLRGPNVHRNSFDFKCVFTFPKQDSDQAFEVVWTFDGATDANIPSQILSDPLRQATLDGSKLVGHLNSALQCKVRSFYKQNQGTKSEYRESNAYYVGIQIEPAKLVVNEKDFSKTVKVKSTIPVICTDMRRSCCLNFFLDVDVKEVSVPNKCTYEMCADSWEPQTQTATLEVPVVANQDMITDGDKRLLMTFHKLLPANGGAYLDVFANHKVDQLPVVVEDQRTATCSITGDPHIKGFDYQTYHLYMLGDYTAYQVSSRHFQIQIRNWRCGRVTCVCGVVIREKNDVIRIDQCDQIYNHGTTSPTVEIPRPLREGTVIQRSRDSKTIAVYLPSGAEIKVNAHPSVLNVFITAPSIDTGKGMGICGTNDGRKDNEFTHPDGTIDPVCADGAPNCQPTKFLQSWKVSRENSLFEKTPDKINDQDELKYCACNNQERTVNCTTAGNVKSPHILCRKCPIINPKPIPPRPNRRKREVVYEDTDSPDAPYPDPDEQTNISTVDVNKGWPNDQGISEEEARDMCTKAAEKSQLNSKCGGMNNMAAIAITDCMSDILFGGSTEFLDAVTSAYTIGCQLELAKDPANYVTNPEGYQVMMPEYLDDVCDLACEEHGKCGPRGTCVCDAGWEGDNCHIQSGKGPQMNKIRSGSLCDTAERPCRTIYIDVSNIDLSDDLICRVRLLDEQNSTVGKPVDTEATLMSGYRMTCGLPETKVTYQHYKVSASNDGSLFGNELSVHVFDSTCMDCSEMGCTAKTTESCTRNDAQVPRLYTIYILLFLVTLLPLFYTA